MKIITLAGFEQVKTAMANVAESHPEWFPKGFNEIHAVSNDGFFAAVNGGDFFISNTEALVKGFNPAHTLIEAISKASNGELLTFNQEYSIETLWHEIMHGRTGIGGERLLVAQEPVSEGFIQLSARHTYQILLKALGGRAQHLDSIITGGLSYPVVTRNLLELITEAGITGEEVERILIANGENWQVAMKEKLSVALNTKRVGSLLNAASSSDLNGFKQKIKMQQRNAPLRSKE